MLEGPWNVDDLNGHLPPCQAPHMSNMIPSFCPIRPTELLDWEPGNLKAVSTSPAPGNRFSASTLVNSDFGRAKGSSFALSRSPVVVESWPWEMRPLDDTLWTLEMGFASKKGLEC